MTEHHRSRSLSTLAYRRPIPVNASDFGIIIPDMPTREHVRVEFSVSGGWRSSALRRFPASRCLPAAGRPRLRYGAAEEARV